MIFAMFKKCDFICHEDFVYTTFWNALGLFFIITLITLCTIPIAQAPLSTISFGDKIHHFVFYFGMGFYFRTYSKDRYHLRLLLFLFFLGITLEGIQYGLPWRSFEWMDMVTNGTGLIASTFLPSKFSRSVFRHLEQIWRKRLL